MEPECAFCAAAAGRSTTQVVYEAEDVFALVPRGSAALGHLMVIPREHVADLWELEPATAAPLTDAILRISRAIRGALRPDGLNVITSAGAAAGQTVTHLHIHLVPRWERDAFGDIWPRPNPPFAPPDLLDATTRVRSALARSRVSP